MSARLGLAFVIATIVAATAAPVLQPQDGAVLGSNKADGLLRQCSRPTPKKVNGNWVPESKQIRQLEASLPDALEKETRKRNLDYPSEFFRQYVGLLIGGRKIIYVNAFAKANYEQTVWTKDPIRVCDGGSNYFGVEYDPSTKGFFDFAFNGTA